MQEPYKIILDHIYDLKLRIQSEEYYKKYWLPESEWINTWKSIKDTIFLPKARHLPDMMFQEEYELIISIGGVIFTQESFSIFQDCMTEVGDNYLIFIENEYMLPGFTDKKKERIFYPPRKFKFPVNITWQELNSGGLASFEVFKTIYREFFIFGDRGIWGRYIANEYWDIIVNKAGTPLDILGFKPQHSSIFKKKFKQTEEERNRIKTWIPAVYKNRINFDPHFR